MFLDNKNSIFKSRRLWVLALSHITPYVCIFYMSPVNELRQCISLFLMCSRGIKISRLPSKLRFSANCSFFGQSFSRGHYPPIYQPQEGLYLLNIPALPNNYMVNESINGESWIKIFPRNWRPLEIV